jgi:hypothetical protein
MVINAGMERSAMTVDYFPAKGFHQFAGQGVDPNPASTLNCSMKRQSVKQAAGKTQGSG